MFVVAYFAACFAAPASNLLKVGQIEGRLNVGPTVQCDMRAISKVFNVQSKTDR